VLQLVLSSPTVSGVATAKVRVYAVNYNVLRVMSGINRKNQLCQKTTRHKQTGNVCGNFGCAPVNKISQLLVRSC
jgi:hypothetical protein